MALSPKTKTEEILQSGALVANLPGLAGQSGDAMPYIVTTSEVAFGSLATNFSRRVIPFAYKVLDFYTRLIQAPVGGAAQRKLVLGTATNQTLFFVSGNFFFNSQSSLSLLRRGTASNFQAAAAQLGTAGQFLQMTAKPVATALSTKGAVVGVIITVPR